ncbi:Ribonuclease H domain, partial [Trinorchestia longiramus]
VISPQIGSSSLLPTFIASVRAIFPKVDLPSPSGNAALIISPLPPRFRTDDSILTEVLPSSASSLTSQSVIQTSNELMDTKFADYKAIFTDRSRITEPNCSSSAAVVVPSKRVTLNWKLCSQKQVIECELHAIHEALSWISENSDHSDIYVIFTDSLSSLYLIYNTKPEYYIPLVYNIGTKLINITFSHCIRMQFIPGHRGVSGNEAGDSAAKAAHLLRYCTLTSYSKEETLGRLVSESAFEREDPGSNPAADMVDAARNTAWDLGKQPNNYRSNYPTQEWARRCRRGYRIHSSRRNCYTVGSRSNEDSWVFLGRWSPPFARRGDKALPEIQSLDQGHPSPHEGRMDRKKVNGKRLNKCTESVVKFGCINVRGWKVGKFDDLAEEFENGRLDCLGVVETQMRDRVRLVSKENKYQVIGKGRVKWQKKGGGVGLIVKNALN